MYSISLLVLRPFLLLTEAIMAPVWRGWWAPPVCQAEPTAQQITAARRQINGLTPAANHLLPAAPSAAGEPREKTFPEDVLSSPPDPLCPFILPLKRPAVLLIVGGK